MAEEQPFDAVVSVEMIEAVGRRYLPDYFQAIERNLAPGGRVAIQSITMAHHRMLATQDSYSWIHKYVFPGGLIPSIAELGHAAATAGLRLAARRDFGLDYARTLRDLAPPLRGELAAGRHAGLRRGVPPHVAVLSGLLRGWVLFWLPRGFAALVYPKVTPEKIQRSSGNLDGTDFRITPADANAEGGRMDKSYEAEFAELVAAKGGALRRAAYLMCGDWHLAEDLVQNVFVKVHLHWHRIKRQDSFDGYLRTVLFRTFVDSRRLKWRREYPAEYLPDAETPGSAPSDDRDVLVAALRRYFPGNVRCWCSGTGRT